MGVGPIYWNSRLKVAPTPWPYTEKISPAYGAFFGTISIPNGIRVRRSDSLCGEVFVVVNSSFNRRFIVHPLEFPLALRHTVQRYWNFDAESWSSGSGGRAAIKFSASRYS